MKKLPNLHMYRDVNGTFRCYVRRKGAASIPILGKIGSPKFMAAYQAAMKSKRLPTLPRRMRSVGDMEFEEGHSVYFLRGRGTSRIKIGTTRNAGKRLIGIQAASPVPLTVLAIVPGDARLERDVHERFAHLREHGEWFKSSPELLVFIAGLRRKIEREADNGSQENGYSSNSAL